ncbi:ThiF family adenylyltransferase [Candidatus Omnitrophota bacterium]
MNLRDDQVQRYLRHILLPEIGEKGQEKLLGAKVLLIGAGGLGSPCTLYLAAAGVGKLGIVDSDKVEISNLQRQIVHSTKSIGTYKADSAKERLTDINSDTEVVVYNVRLTAENILEIIRGYDIVVDGSDNPSTRYLVNDACVLSKKPLSHGGVLRFGGQLITILPGESACYRCLFPEPPLAQSCAEAGILGVVPGVIGTMQANEVIKYILEIGDLLTGRLLIFDGLNSSFREVNVGKDPKCPICSQKPTITEVIDYKHCKNRDSDYFL